jgi:lytic murein transglycosylase
MRARLFAIVTLLACLFAASSAAAAVNRAALESQFRTWIEKDLWPEARRNGVSRQTFNAAMGKLALNWKLPDLNPPGSSGKGPAVQRQSEFRAPAAYFNAKRLANLTRLGRSQLAKWRGTLDAVEKRYGVPREIIVAIWARESDFGRAPLPYDAVRSLATQAFMGRRKDLFRTELLAALKILQEGHIPPGKMKSAWAGALGQPQFMPSKFLEHAVDFDADGRRDIWNSVPDTLASIAHFLQSHGWQSGRDWGFEANVPANVSCALEGPEQGRPVKVWIDAGVTRVSGKPFPGSEHRKTGYLMMPAGRLGPAFIATENFYTLKFYNESDLYALYIGHLADRMRGAGSFKTGWSKLDRFNRHDVRVMQERLVGLGHDVGGVDGLVGFKTRTATGAWQEKNGQTPTCFPGTKVLRALR